MRAILLLALVPFLVGCLEQAAPTPVEVQQYPATWTPAPTPTNTPLPPTATLVIQRTPGTFSTRDPNARILPIAPRNGFGIALTVTSETSKILAPVAARANVIFTDGSANIPRTGFVFLNAAATTLGANELLAPQYAGVVYENARGSDADALAAKRAALTPRLVLASLTVTDTATLAKLASVTDGLRLENFLRAPDSSNAQFKLEAEWKADVDTLDALSSNATMVLVTNTRLSAVEEESEVPPEQWLSYALASFLLGANNSHTFFSFESPLTPQVLDTPLLNIELGSPQAGMFKQNNVYQRRFTRGLVLVNPSDNRYAFSLSRNYLDVNGTRVDQVEMLPHTGMILLNVE